MVVFEDGSFCLSGHSACSDARCQLCQLTKRNSAGFTCSCEKSKMLFLNGKCDCKFDFICVCCPHLLAAKLTLDFILKYLIKCLNLCA